MTEELGEPGSGPPPLSPGKRAPTDSMGSIQMKRTPGGAVSTAAIHDAAARGVSTTASALPFADQVQASFGPEHDVSKIQAHVGSDAPQAMGAEAFASGNHVVFGRQPDLHTVAHEAAHVIQQANGVHLYGGVGEARDAHEQHADSVADRVVAGRSAADLFGTATRGAAPQSHAVQMKPAAITPAKQSDFVIPLPQDSFTVSFELLSAGADDVRVVIAPADFSRAYQSELKYWDVKGREVDKDDSYVSMGNWSVPAQPNQQMTQVATPAKFDPIDLQRLPGPLPRSGPSTSTATASPTSPYASISRSATSFESTASQLPTINRRSKNSASTLFRTTRTSMVIRATPHLAGRRMILSMR
jgi:hypothetical protein